MNQKIPNKILKHCNPLNLGPAINEIYKELAEEHFTEGEAGASTFYQVLALYNMVQQSIIGIWKAENEPKPMELEIIGRMNKWERKDYVHNPLMQYTVKTLSNATTKPSSGTRMQRNGEKYNFLTHISDPAVGLQKIKDVCSQLPKEWTVIQISKGPIVESTYEKFNELHGKSATIYLTVLKHARSEEYPSPILWRFIPHSQSSIFRLFAEMPLKFNKCLSKVKGGWEKTMVRQIYYRGLQGVEDAIKVVIDEMKEFFYPWNFLFRGIPFYCIRYPEKHLAVVYKMVDTFCCQYKWNKRQRVLLSLAALQINSIDEAAIIEISRQLTEEEEQQHEACKVLNEVREYISQMPETVSTNNLPLPSYPCILILDEHLDHFFWEELHVDQEYCRFNSLQSLWRMFQLYKDRLHQGYLPVNIAKGSCVINCDNNLPNLERRMKSFFTYYTPHWNLKAGCRPTQDEFFNDFLKNDCYVYAGHGSGIHFFRNYNLARLDLNCVVFLFGCESVRLKKGFLNSHLHGQHLYYHAAKCPTVVGCLITALDSNMDENAASILSHWLKPTFSSAVPWHGINFHRWQSVGEIMPKVMATPPPISWDHGSLCRLVSFIHQRMTWQEYYHTVHYVVRGLPVWNCEKQPLP